MTHAETKTSARPGALAQQEADFTAGQVAVQPDPLSGDWETLLATAKGDLASALDQDRAALRLWSPRVTSDLVQVSDLACMAVLDRLRGALTHELAVRRQLELQVLSAEAALSQAHAELAGTQAGEKDARHLALHDALTALPNRRFFHQQLNQALFRIGPTHRALAVLYLDLDGFKAINDVHGHQAGDEVLRIVAARLARAVRANDMMSRLGGDEFACLLPDFPDREHLSHLACKLLEVVSAPLSIGKLTLTVRPSIGIATGPVDGTTSEALLSSADAAMYRAKLHKTGYAFVEPHPGSQGAHGHAVGRLHAEAR